MKEEWREVHLRDICEFKYGKNLPESKRVPGKYKVYGSSSVTGTHNEFLVKGPGIIVGRKGTVGKVQYSKEDFFPIDTTYFVDIDSEQVNLLFLYYRLPLCGFEGMNSDAAIPGLNRTAAINCKINLPSLSTQQKIANILSAYDDLIENNTKRIELLEEQAQLIYEEWFVRMKFPDYENTQVDAETDLPEGWGYKKIGSLVEVTSSKRIFLSDYVEKGIPFFRGKEIILKSKNEPLNDRLYITQEKFNTISKKFGVPTTGDVLITAVGTLGYPYLVTEDDGDFYFKDGNLIWLKNDNKVLSSYLISCFKNENFKARLNSIAIGSSQKALTIKSLKALNILLPYENLLEGFNDLVQPRFELISKLQVQNRYLKEARDILLPRLMMGIIEIEKA